jgi:hypothetical protein
MNQAEDRRRSNGKFRRAPRSYSSGRGPSLHASPRRSPPSQVWIEQRQRLGRGGRARELQGKEKRWRTAQKALTLPCLLEITPSSLLHKRPMYIHHKRKPLQPHPSPEHSNYSHSLYQNPLSKRELHSPKLPFTSLLLALPGRTGPIPPSNHRH